MLNPLAGRNMRFARRARSQLNIQIKVVCCRRFGCLPAEPQARRLGDVALGLSLPSQLAPGDPFPWIALPSNGKPQLACLASRYSLLCFVGSVGDAAGAAAVAALREGRRELEAMGVQAYVVTLGRDERLVAEPYPVPLFDGETTLSRLCGRFDEETRRFRRGWIVVDPTLHVLATFDFSAESDGADRLFEWLRRMPPPHGYAGFEIPAPVLTLPNVFEPEICAALIAYYEADGGKVSGIYAAGANAFDNSFKSRRDVHIADRELQSAVRERFLRRVAPEIRKLFFVDLTRLERYLIGCYASEEGGRFGAHRDIGAVHTAHRRFALSINLNADFEGGGVLFPEFNTRALKAPPGWAVVFPAAILHSVLRVTRGRRYAYLDFLYDEAGEALRQKAGRI